MVSPLLVAFIVAFVTITIFVLLLLVLLYDILTTLKPSEIDDEIRGIEGLITLLFFLGVLEACYILALGILMFYDQDDNGSGGMRTLLDSSFPILFIVGILLPFFIIIFMSSIASTSKNEHKLRTQASFYKILTMASISLAITGGIILTIWLNKIVT